MVPRKRPTALLPLHPTLRMIATPPALASSKRANNFVKGFDRMERMYIPKQVKNVPAPEQRWPSEGICCRVVEGILRVPWFQKSLMAMWSGLLWFTGLRRRLRVLEEHEVNQYSGSQDASFEADVDFLRERSHELVLLLFDML